MKKIICIILALFLLPAAVLAAAPALEAEGYAYRVNPDGGAVILGYLGEETTLVLPGTLAGMPVTGLGEEAFAYQQLDSVTLPRSLETMEINPFLGCPAIVRPGENPHYIAQDSALVDTRTGTLVSFALPKGQDSFQAPDSVLHIAPRAFYGAGGLKQAALPASVRSIGEQAFAECTALESVTLPGGLTSIPEQAFLGCVMLKDIDIPASVTHIGAWAFAKSGLQSVILPEGLLSVADWAFLRCNDLVGISLPASLKEISDSAFDSVSPDALFTVYEGSAGEAWAQDSPYNYQLEGL
jgi:hypothetical protein